MTHLIRGWTNEACLLAKMRYITRNITPGLSTLQVLDTTSGCHDNNEDIEDILSVIDEISAELLREHYEDHEQFSERALSATLESLSDDIVCPLCLKYVIISPLYHPLIYCTVHRSVLVQRGSVIMCTCGLAIDTMVCITINNINNY